MRRIALAFAALLVPAATLAQDGPPNFPRTYQYDQPLAGWVELNLWTTGVVDSNQPYDSFDADTTRDGLIAHSLEVEYGVTDRLTAGGYLNFEDARGQPFRFTEGRLLARYRFSNRQDLFVNPAVYVEYYLPRKGAGEQELELRLIADKDLNDFRLAANPRLEFETTGPDADGTPRLGLDLGVYYRRNGTFQPGLEYHSDFGRVGDWKNQYHYVEPTVDIGLGKQVTWHLGAGVGFAGKRDGLIAQSILTADLDVLRPSVLFGRRR